MPADIREVRFEPGAIHFYEEGQRHWRSVGLLGKQETNLFDRWVPAAGVFAGTAFMGYVHK